jgi:membrane dipeptidase
MLIIDAHEDLAWNILTFGRDYTRSARATRQHEAGTSIPANNGDTLLGWPDYRRGQVAVIFGSLFAAPLRRQSGAWDTQVYASPAQAHALYQAQIDAYLRLVDEHPDHFRLIWQRADLAEVLAQWESASPLPAEEPQEGPEAGTGQDLASAPAATEPGPPVGVVILMEGAEGVRTPSEVDEWWARGVRLVGPAWAGNQYCGGTREPGPLTPAGFSLLENLAAFGFTLDLSHMDEKAALQALDHYPGAIVATHSNPAALLKGLESNRFLSDRVIQGLIERQGVIGVVPFNRFLLSGWQPSQGRAAVSLQQVVAHIDYICQLAGDATHVGFGSDFDGGFGLQSAPAGLDSIADLQKIAPLLAEKGYTEREIAAILGKNWQALLERTLPE